jgi:hypothetical protein
MEYAGEGLEAHRIAVEGYEGDLPWRVLDSCITLVPLFAVFTTPLEILQICSIRAVSRSGFSHGAKFQKFFIPKMNNKESKPSPSLRLPLTIPNVMTTRRDWTDEQRRLQNGSVAGVASITEPFCEYSTVNWLEKRIASIREMHKKGVPRTISNTRSPCGTKFSEVFSPCS